MLTALVTSQPARSVGVGLFFCFLTIQRKKHNTGKKWLNIYLDGKKSIEFRAWKERLAENKRQSGGNRRGVRAERSWRKKKWRSLSDLCFKWKWLDSFVLLVLEKEQSLSRVLFFPLVTFVVSPLRDSHSHSLYHVARFNQWLDWENETWNSCIHSVHAWAPHAYQRTLKTFYVNEWLIRLKSECFFIVYPHKK